MHIYRLFLITVFANFILCCNTSTSNQFTIKGKAKHAAGKKIQLQSFGPNNSNPIIFDTCIIDNKEIFSVSATGNIEELYALQIDSTQYWFANDAKEIEINIDVHQPKQYSIQGSVASNSIKQFLQQTDSLQNILHQKQALTDSAKKNKLSDSIVTVRSLDAKLAKEKTKSYYEQFIQKANSPAVVYFSLFYGYHTKNIEPQLAFAQATKAKETYPNYPQIQLLYNVIATAAKGNPVFILTNNAAPKFTATTVQGDTVNFPINNGKYVLLDFWASWCKPYRDATPALTETFKAFKDTSFTIVGICLDTNYAAMQKAIKQDSLNWKHIQQPAMYNGEILKKYLVTNVPFNVLINPKGKIEAVNISIEELKERLKNIFSR